jgi:hypothetical protein
MAVAPLSHSARDYVRAFDLTRIALWRDGRLGVFRNPTGADQAWWCPAKAAGVLVRAANANGRDVAQAAARPHTPLTDHATVAERATEARVLRRLRKAVAGAAANGGLINALADAFYVR